MRSDEDILFLAKTLINLVCIVYLSVLRMEGYDIAQATHIKLPTHVLRNVRSCNFLLFPLLSRELYCDTNINIATVTCVSFAQDTSKL